MPTQIGVGMAAVAAMAVAPRCSVPECDGANASLTRHEEDALARRRECAPTRQMGGSGRGPVLANHSIAARKSVCQTRRIRFQLD